MAGADAMAASAELEQRATQLLSPGAFEFSVFGEASSIGPPALAGKGPVKGQAAAYICTGPSVPGPRDNLGGFL